MHIRVKVHSHDTGLPEHDQVQFHTPEHPGGLMVLRLPKGAPLPPVDSEYTAEFLTDEQLAARDIPAPPAPPADNAHVAEGAERFDDEHGPAGSDQGGA